jgi:hypothetical protein
MPVGTVVEAGSVGLATDGGVGVKSATGVLGGRLQAGISESAIRAVRIDFRFIANHLPELLTIIVDCL